MVKNSVIIDYALVPTGVMLLMAYHIWLFRCIIRRPTTTIIGLNAIHRRLWVSSMMQDVGKNGVLAVQTLRNNIMASTLLASTAIMLSSLIAVIMTSGKDQSPADGIFFLGGKKTHLDMSVKFFSILVCFLSAFFLNVQSIRYYSHASVLINVDPQLFPHHETQDDGEYVDAMVVVGYEGYVARMVNRGSYFWSLGLRAFYVSFPLFLWIFGPIPMFLCCLVLLSMLYFLDMAFHSKCGVHALSCGGRETQRTPRKLDLEM